MFTESIWSGRNPAASIAAFDAAVCNCVEVTFLKAPPNVPKAVRLALTIKIPVGEFRIRYNTLYCPGSNYSTFRCSRHLSLDYLSLNRFNKIPATAELSDWTLDPGPSRQDKGLIIYYLTLLLCSLLLR